jgi:5-methylcytosine-specific restriction endonuclease McrA
MRRSAQPELYRASARARRARIASVLTTLTAEQWEAILEAAGHACIYCGSHEQPTQDHLTPLTRGGQHTAENVAPACGPCNQSKGTKIASEFLAEAV